MTLKTWLKSKGLTGKEFAKRAGVSETIVCRVQQGHVPKLRAAQAIQKATGNKVRL